MEIVQDMTCLGNVLRIYSLSLISINGYIKQALVIPSVDINMFLALLSGECAQLLTFAVYVFSK